MRANVCFEGGKRPVRKRPLADTLILANNAKVDVGKWGFVLFLLFLAALALFGVSQKLRDGEVGWKFNDLVSRRHGKDRLGFWFSVSFNVAFAVAALWLAIAVAFDRIPTT